MLGMSPLRGWLVESTVTSLWFFQNVRCQSAQDTLGTYFDEDARALFVKRGNALNELDRGSHLGRQDIQDLGAAGGIGFAGHVGNDRDLRGLHVHAVDDLAQRLAGRANDAGVEGVRNRDLGGLQASGQEGCDGRIHGRGCPADHALHRAVDVGDDNVAFDGLQDALHFGQRGRDGRHAAIVIRSHFGHFLSTRADHLQGFGQAQDTGSHQGGIFAQAVSDDHIGLEPVLFQHPQERDVHCQQGRLGDIRAAQFQAPPG